MASSEYFTGLLFWPGTRSGTQASIAPSVNQTVMSPRLLNASLYSDQFGHPIFGFLELVTAGIVVFVGIEAVPEV